MKIITIVTKKANLMQLKAIENMYKARGISVEFKVIIK